MQKRIRRAREPDKYPILFPFRTAAQSVFSILLCADSQKRNTFLMYSIKSFHSIWFLAHKKITITPYGLCVYPHY